MGRHTPGTAWGSPAWYSLDVDEAAPHLLHSTPFRTASRVEIAWSQPVTFASAKATGAKALLKKVKDMLPSRGSDVKTFSLCHASTCLGGSHIYDSAQARDALSNLEGGRTPLNVKQ